LQIEVILKRHVAHRSSSRTSQPQIRHSLLFILAEK